MKIYKIEIHASIKRNNPVISKIFALLHPLTLVVGCLLTFIWLMWATEFLQREAIANVRVRLGSEKTETVLQMVRELGPPTLVKTSSGPGSYYVSSRQNSEWDCVSGEFIEAAKQIEDYKSFIIPLGFCTLMLATSFFYLIVYPTASIFVNECYKDALDNLVLLLVKELACAGTATEVEVAIRRYERDRSRLLYEIVFNVMTIKEIFNEVILCHRWYQTGVHALKKFPY
jgi:hypothetical protein